MTLLCFIVWTVKRYERRRDGSLVKTRHKRGLWPLLDDFNWFMRPYKRSKNAHKNSDPSRPYHAIDWGKQSTLSHARLHGQGGLAAQLENFAWVWESLRRSIEYMNTLITAENHRFIVAAAEAAAYSSLVLTSLFTVSVVVQLGLQCKCYLTRGQSSVSTLNT